MQIDKINFNGRYKTLVTPQELDKFEEKTLPILKELHNDYVDFSYENPMEYIFADIANDIAEDNNCSYEWVIDNARNHGIKFSDSATSVLWVVTGKKDCEKFNKFIDKREKKHANNFKKLVKYVCKNCLDIPNHLVALKAADLCADIERKKFAEFIKKNPFKTMKTPEDIIFEDAVKI